MVINHLDKLFVTSDAATIIRELEVVHPAGKVLVMASQQQEHEVRPLPLLRSSLFVPPDADLSLSPARPQMGDRTNLVLILAGELLRKAEYLLTMGLHPSEVVLGYELARDRAIEELESASAPPLPPPSILPLSSSAQADARPHERPQSSCAARSRRP